MQLVQNKNGEFMQYKTILALLTVNLMMISAAFLKLDFTYFLYISIPLLFLSIYDTFQEKHSLMRNFPIIGRFRWVMEFVRPFIQQYIIEPDTGGAPIPRMFRTIVYQRAKNSRDTIPFGTQIDTYSTGYEWIGHSIGALDVKDIECSPRIKIGGRDCTQPYSASILNISAMSFGSLSKPALQALNKGASLGQFYHNTGEGGVSSYHLEHGGDLVWQVGTGYFGCRSKGGGFDAALFAEQSSHEHIKMIEIKLSQGAKPGHGGILPASKNTPEIAAIRGVEAGTQVDSPAYHKAFSTPLQLVSFIAQLRELSQGKPIGFKLAVGRKSEFIAICKAMVELNIRPDFITVDGGEGGTGAAPLEYSNSIGSPLREGLAFVDDCLIGFGLRSEIKLIASGKVISGFHLVKNLALGADICNSARGMMMALGCVQSLSCNSNHCPTGVATQNPRLYKGLVVTDKATRVYNFHKKTVHAAVDIMSSSGISTPSELNRTHIFRRVSQQDVKRYDQIFPLMQPNCFVLGNVPKRYEIEFAEASKDTFKPLVEFTRIDKTLTSLAS
ncbi:MAG: glutamate synthase domain-containing protein 2 [Patiriisocius sp.]|jgi:glutamate synthase domain-containing protein 2